MGCIVSKKSLDSSDGKAPQFRAATDDEDDEEDQGDAGSTRAIDRAAIEEQSYRQGEQSLLALAMNGKPREGGDGDKYASSSLKIQKITVKHLSEASPRERGVADATTIGGATSAPPVSLNPVTSPIKIRIQEPVSSVITIEEHEHSKLLPDLKYSMRVSANGERDQLHHLEHGAGETGGQFGQLGVGFGANASQPFNAARKLQPITTTQAANTLGGGFITHLDQQQHQPAFPPRGLQPVQGIVPVDRMQYTTQQAGRRGGGASDVMMMPRGRGAGRGFAGPISPLYRGGPIQGQIPVAGIGSNGFAGRGAGASPGAVLAGPRGIPRPLHAMAVQSGGSQRGQTAATFRQPEANRQPAGVLLVLPVTVQKSASGKGSGAGDNDDDDDDLVADDDEVGDWDLDEEPTKEVKKPSKAAQPPIDSSMSFKKQPPMPIQTSNTVRATEPPSPQKQPSKFRPTHENANDFGDIVTVVGDDDDDDDSNFGDGNEDVEDWFEADSPTATASARANKLPVQEPEGSPTKLVPTSPAMHASSSSPSISPAMTPTIFRHASPPLSNEALKSSPHPPPMQRLPSRQIAATLGNLSPTKPVVGGIGIGSPTVGGSPLKQVSYRSSIMNTGQSVLLPMAVAGGTPNAGGVADSNAPIRDTKVVKKKRAELPQRNLPHPTPKFGDWLNSRTMINNYIILESLGSGSYAEVKLCKEKVSGKLFAMKFINRDIMKKDKLGKQSKLDDIKREIAIMKKLNHPNVLRLYEVMDDPSMNKLFLVLEYMKHGDLLSHQKKKHNSSLSAGSGTGSGAMMESLHDRDLHCVVLQVLLGLAYLHEQKIVHGDIKPQNILVGDKDAVKIADFGISQSLYGSKQKLTDTAGTPAFMSPEMCSGEEYSGQMADIWAVGATIFMLKFGNPPFVAKSAMQMFEKIQSDPLVFSFPIDPLLQNLLTGMMIKDPLKRMTLLEVMSHPWVTKEETLSNYSIRQQAPQITVSNDEIEHAIDSKGQFAIIVNIRIQMMKKLQKARQETLERQRRLHHADAEDTSSGGGLSVQQPSTAGTGEEHRKVVKLKSPKLKQNKVHADHHHSSGKYSHADLKAEADAHEMLSNEEISYRSQMFSRKKTGSTAAPTGKVRDQGNCGFENEADVDSASQDTDDDDDDDDILSSDDDEIAVAQSPQLLDELLLTTLSMPPLTKTKSTGEKIYSQDLSSDDRSTSQKDGAIVPTHPAPMIDSNEGFYGVSSILSLHFGVASLQGRRSTQEDRWVVLPEIKGMVAPKYSQSAFVGLFDGHGGEECSNILHEQLHSWIFRDPHDLTLTPAILQTCFEELDTYVCDYLLQKGDLSGSTATCAILSPSDDGKKIRGIVAHVGDCRLVLSLRNNEVRDITEDHRLTMIVERDRILQLGGRVVNNRVNGVMAITRAFGDLEFKGLLGKKSGGAGASSSSSSSSTSLIPSIVQQNPFQKDEEKIPALLTARPDVHMLELDPAVHEFLLLACDGLWDVMSSEEAVEIFRDRLHFHWNLQLAAKELAQEAIRRYSNDNITVVAIQVGGSGGHPK